MTLVSSPEPEGQVVRGSTRCGRCGVALDARAWGGLELVELVAPERVRQHVTIWPGETPIEVRRCGCGRALARKAAPDEED
jgi:hypothetical protein